MYFEYKIGKCILYKLPNLYIAFWREKERRGYPYPLYISFYQLHFFTTIYEIFYNVVYMEYKQSKKTIRECSLSEDKCSICHHFVGTNLISCVRINPCGHLFHRDCLRKWKMENNTCPNCGEIIKKTVPCCGNPDNPCCRMMGGKMKRRKTKKRKTKRRK